MNAPSPAAIKQARVRAGLTQSQAAVLVRVTLRSWQHWEGGTRTMSAPTWELFTVKAAGGAAHHQ